MRIPWTNSGLIEEECGIELARLQQWKSASSHGCSIELEALSPRESGVLLLPRTRMTISGNATQCEAAYKDFYLRFMSAGG